MVLATLLVALVGAGGLAFGIELSVENVESTIIAWGAWGVVLSIVLMVAHSFVPFPAEIIALANGMAYGWLWGTVITWTGAMLGAIVAFALARALAPRLHARWLTAERRAQLARQTAQDGWWVLLMARLMPAVAFNLINYAAGFSGVAWGTFLWTTAIGILPLTVAMTVIGDGLLRPTWLSVSVTLFVLAGLAGLLWWRRRGWPSPVPPWRRCAWAVATGVMAFLAAAAAWSAGGARMLGLFALGAAAGLTLHHARFGFASAWRQAIRERNGRGLRAQLLMLALAVVGFFPLLAAGEVAGRPILGAVAPVGPSVALGAFLFGLGMQLSGGCASGTLYTAGTGSARMALTLLAFVGGSVLGTAHLPFWSTLPAVPATSLVAEFGVARGIVVQLTVIGVLATASLALERGREVRRPVPEWNLLRGPWPLLAGAVLLALINLATLLLAGHPWAVTFAFALWGAKALVAAGVAVETWPFWRQLPGKLTASIWTDVTSVMNIGIVIGAALAALAADRFRPTLRLDTSSLLSALSGGLLLGYGARLAYGCNIGAFFSGVASGSLHGWLWLVCAYAGFCLAERLRRDRAAAPEPSPSAPR